MESCIISKWNVKVGDQVKTGDPLFTYETDKATFDEESKFDGTVLAIFFQEGDDVPCLTNVCVIGAPGDGFAEFDPNASAASAAPAAQAQSAPLRLHRHKAALLRRPLRPLPMTENILSLRGPKTVPNGQASIPLS